MTEPEPAAASGDPDRAAPEAETFESALARLDGIVRRMDAEDVGLEEALRLFEEGHRYLAICRERLALAERRIEELTLADPDATGESPPEPGPAGAAPDAS